jgi:hypothetical protein
MIVSDVTCKLILSDVIKYSAVSISINSEIVRLQKLLTHSNSISNIFILYFPATKDLMLSG